MQNGQVFGHGQPGAFGQQGQVGPHGQPGWCEHGPCLIAVCPTRLAPACKFFAEQREQQPAEEGLLASIVAQEQSTFWPFRHGRAARTKPAWLVVTRYATTLIHAAKLTHQRDMATTERVRNAALPA